MKDTFVVVLLFVLLAGIAATQGDTLFGYIPRSYTAPDTSEQTIPYRLHIPSGYDDKKKYPLVLFLHGAGEWGVDNALQITNCVYNNQCCVVKLLSSQAVQSKYPSFVVAPQAPVGSPWVNTDWSKGSYTGIPLSKVLKSALSIVTRIRREYCIDSTRLYVVGLSMGGFGTWDAIERNPGLFAAAIPICGAADTARAVVARIKNMPIWTFHGDQDPTVPVSGTREIVAALKSMGSQVKYTEIKGGDHLIWPVVCSTSTLMDWLFSQRLDSNNVTYMYAPLHEKRIAYKPVSQMLFDITGRAFNAPEKASWSCMPVYTVSILVTRSCDAKGRPFIFPSILSRLP